MPIYRIFKCILILFLIHTYNILKFYDGSTQLEMVSKIDRLLQEFVFIIYSKLSLSVAYLIRCYTSKKNLGFKSQQPHFILYFKQPFYKLLCDIIVYKPLCDSAIYTLDIHFSKKVIFSIFI